MTLSWPVSRFNSFQELLNAEATAAQTLPCNIAWFARRMTETGEAVKVGDKGSLLAALDAVKLGFYHLSKTYALIAAVHYLNDGDFATPALSDRISDMRMPFDSTWGAFLKKFAQVYVQEKRPFPIPGFLAALNNTIFDDRNHFEVQVKGRPSRKDAFSAAIAVRNSIIGHRNIEMSFDTLFTSYTLYREITAWLFGVLHFLDGRHVALAMADDLADDPQDTGIVLLHGWNRNDFELRRDILTEDTQALFLASRLCLVVLNTGSVFPLDPFYRLLDVHDDPDIAARDAYLLYEAMGQRDIYFNGIFTDVKDRQVYKSIRRLMETKVVELVLDIKKYRLPMLAGFSRDATALVLERHYLNKKYFPELYVERQDMALHLDQFLAGPEIGLIITGVSGIGKSALLAHLARQYLASTAAQSPNNRLQTILFFINAAAFTTPATGSRILSALLQTLCLKGELASFRAFLDSVQHMVQLAEQPIRLVFLIDALNEARDIHALWKEVDELVNQAVSGKGKQIYAPEVQLKLVVAIRDTGLSQLRETLLNEKRTAASRHEEPLFARDYLYYRIDAPGLTKKNPFLPLLPLTGTEQTEAFHKYLGEQAAHLTFDAPTRAVLANPLYLRIYADLLEKGSSPETISGMGLLEAWLDWLEGKVGDTWRNEFCFEQVRHTMAFMAEQMLTSATSDVSLQELSDFVEAEAVAARNRGQVDYVNSRELLRSEGLLVFDGREAIKIPDQKLRELVLTRYLEPCFQSAPLGAAEIAAKMAEYGSVDWPDIIGGLAWLLQRRLDQGQVDVLTDIWDIVWEIGAEKLSTDASYNIWEVFFRYNCIGHSGLSDNTRRLIDALKGTSNSAIPVILAVILHGMAFDQRHINPTQAIELYRTSLDIFHYLHEKLPERIELAKRYSVTCSNLAGLLENMGEVNITEALKLYRNALCIIHKLHEKHPEHIDLARYYGATCNNLALPLRNMGDDGIVEAIELCRTSLDIRRKLYDKHPECIDFANSYNSTCNNLAMLLQNMGTEGFTEALKLHRTALNISRNLYEKHPEHIDLARYYGTTCNNLAGVLRNMGEAGIDEALKMCRTAMDINRNLYEKHPERIDLTRGYATICNNLALLLQNMGEAGFAKSIELYRTALGIIHKLHEKHPEHIDLSENYCATCNNLALLLRNMGDDGIFEAIELCRTSLDIRRKLHEKHPERIDLAENYGTTCNNLAGLIENMGEEGFAESIKLHRTSIDISRRLYERHPERTDLADIYGRDCNNLAGVLENMGEEGNDEALKLYRKSLDIRRKLHEKHPERIDLAENYGTTCNNLAGVLQNIGQEGITEALKLCRTALNIFHNLHEKHPERIDLADSYGTTCNNVAGLFQNMGEEGFVEALNLHRKALDIRRNLYEKHPERIDLAQNYGTTCNNLAMLLENMGKEGFAEALELCRTALGAFCNLHEKNPERIDLADSYGTTCNHMAMLLQNMGEEGFAEALNLHRKALDISRNLYEKHPERIDLAQNYGTTCNNVAGLLQNMDKEDFAEALNLHRTALDIHRNLHEKHSERTDLADSYGIACNNLARLLKNMGKEGFSEALKLHRTALYTSRNLHEKHPGRIDLAHSYGSICHNLAILLQNMGKEGIAEALKLYRTALDISRNLYAKHPECIDLVKSYTTICSDLAGLLENMGEAGLDEALKMLRTALDISRKLHKKHPERTDMAKDYGTTCIKLAMLLRSMGEAGFDEALELCRTALGIHRKLHEKHPGRIDLTQDYVIICNSLSMLLENMGKEGFAEALKLYRTALDISRNLYLKHPERIELEQSYGTICNSLAMLLQNMGEAGLAEALKLYHIDLDISRKLYSKHPERIDLFLSFTISQGNIIASLRNHNTPTHWQPLVSEYCHNFPENVKQLTQIMPEHPYIQHLQDIASQHEGS